jgi:branched-chain amino acid transport system permease protein
VSFWVDALNTALIISIFAVSMNVILGVAGQLSIAPAGLGGVGGYLAAYLSAIHGWAFGPCVLAGTAAAGVVGLALGVVTLRLKMDYLILLTLAFATVIVAVFEAIPVLGGSEGLAVTRLVHFGGGTLLTPGQYLPLELIAAAIAAAFCWRLVSSPYGRVLRGIREDGDAMVAVGKNVVAYKVTTFAWTSAVQGLGGTMLVFYQLAASTTQFSFSVTTTMVAAVIVGGMGNALGAFVGAILLTAIGPILEKAVNINPAQASLWQLLIYGALLVVIMRFRPRGLIPEGVRLRDWLPSRRQDDGTPRIASRSPQDRNDLDAELARTGNGVKGGSNRVAGSSTPANSVSPDRLSPPGADHAITAHVPIDVELPHVAVSGRPKMNVGEPVLVVSGLVKTFGGIQALRGFDMTLPAGKITALVGPNGAGKTTVFNLITGRIRSDRGTVTLRGDDITHLPPFKVAARGMARTFQDVRTFMRLTLLDNVALSVPNQAGERFGSLFVRPLKVRRDEAAARAEAMRCLAFVGLEHRADEIAGGLGFGDQKLLALARLLATRSDVLLLDEPASGIDRSSLEPLLEVIERLRETGCTICLVEHNLDVVTRLADHVLFMEAGRVVVEGRMDDIIQQPRLAEVYFGDV